MGSFNDKSKLNSNSISNSPSLSATIGHSSTIGTKTNPLYMRRQTSIKEFIFSLFPFLFIFWMLGGFDMVRNRKQGGVGGMFGNNYSEWDEEDWEDNDDTDSDDVTQQNMDNENKKEQQQQ